MCSAGKGTFMKKLFTGNSSLKLAAIFAALAVLTIIIAVCIGANLLRSGSSSLDEYLGNDQAKNGRESMMVGWCLGNSLDSIAYRRGESVSFYETAWGNPVTTESMISTVKQSGFNAVRVPVTWYDHLDDNGKVDEKWFDRVEEVVNYVLDNNMICILNVHHDTGETAWIKADSSRLEETKEGVASLWKQIAERFRDYDDKLIFEGLNELLNTKNQWTDASYNDYLAVNELNRTFVETVRAAGGSNSSRYLIINTYAASTDVNALAMFVMPEDKADNRLIAGVHYYYSSKNSTDDMFKRVKARFIDNNINVIIGEFGIKGNPSNSGSATERRLYMKSFVTKCRKLGVMGCFCWDDGGSFPDAQSINNYAMLDRSKCQWYDKAMIDAIVSGSDK